MSETAGPVESGGASFFEAVIECVIDGIVVIDEVGTIHSINRAIEEMFGYDRGDLVGKNVKILMPERRAVEHDGYLKAYLETGVPKIIGIGRQENARRRDGSEFPIDLSVTEVPIDGKRHFVGVIRDISEQRESEAIIESQRRSLLELSTPAIQLFEGIVLMPLIGTIDTDRATMLIERLLETISQYQANVAILDVTGVSVIDTDVARNLMKAVAAAKMLGSDVILTGIKPTGAQTLVQLGIDLSHVNTKGSLRSGVEEALRITGRSQG